MRKFLLLLLSLTAFIGQSDAQVVGLKSNLLYSATASPNLGVEIGMGPQTPPRHTHRDLTSLAPHKRLPELPVVPPEKPTQALQLGKTTETPPPVIVR